MIGALILLTAVVIVLSVSIYLNQQENIKYEHYISDNIDESIPEIASSAMYNQVVLEEVVRREEISESQRQLLLNNFADIAEELNILVNLSQRFNRAEDAGLFGLEEVSSSAFGFAHYIDQGVGPVGQGTVELSEKQGESFKLIDRVNDIWVKEIADNIAGISEPDPPFSSEADFNAGTNNAFTQKYWDVYEGTLLNSEDWTDMLHDILEEMETYEVRLINFP